jgi:hypothetical protein
VSAESVSLWVVARQNLFRLSCDRYILKILPDIFFERLSPDLPFPSPLVALSSSASIAASNSEASLLDGERLHQLRPAAVGVEQVQLPAAVAPDLRRPDARRVAHTLARCLQRFLNVGHEQRDVMQGT